MLKLRPQIRSSPAQQSRPARRPGPIAEVPIAVVSTTLSSGSDSHSLELMPPQFQNQIPQQMFSLWMTLELPRFLPERRRPAADPETALDPQRHS